MRVEQLRVAAGAEIGRLHLLDAGAGQRAPRHLRQVEHVPVGYSLAEAGEGAKDLVADFEAARADTGADRGRDGADRIGAFGDDAGGEAAPAAVQHRDAAGANQCHRQTIGDEDQAGQPRLGDHVAVDFGWIGIAV